MTLATKFRSYEAKKFGRVIDRILDPHPQNRPTATEVLAELASISENIPSGAKNTVREKPASETTSPGREVNVWLVDTELPLVVAQEQTLGVDIGEPRSERVGGGAFNEPDWGTANELEIVILVDGAGFDVTPSFQKATLPRLGTMESVFFKITPDGSAATLNLTIFLARELILLEEFSLDFSVQEPQEQNSEMVVANI